MQGPALRHRARGTAAARCRSHLRHTHGRRYGTAAIDILPVVGAASAGWSNDLLPVPVDVADLGGGSGSQAGYDEWLLRAFWHRR